MKKKPKSSPKKPKKAAAKKPTPKKVAKKKPAAKKPAAKKPVKKKPAPKKPVAKKPAPKAKAKVVKTKPAPKKPVAKKPEPKKIAKVQAKPEPKKPVAKPAAPAVKPAKAVKGAPKATEAPAVPAPKPKRPPAPKKKRFIVMPIGPNVPSEIKDDGIKQKGLYKLEYIVYSSPDVLFEFLSTAGGLEKWFAPRVFLKDNTFIFSWGNDEKKEARLLAMKEREFVRFRWADQPEKRYFEFRMNIDDLTSEVALIVSDFADNEVEQDEAKLLWDTQIQDLLHALGSA